MVRGIRQYVKPRCRTGMTLVELLVVLTILAILSAVAVVSTEAVLSQGRFEATQRTMEAVENAVLGPDVLRGEDGTTAIAGFVADIGRLPVAVDVDGELQPAELWEAGSLPAFRFQQATVELVGAQYADTEVYLPCGWRGPYVRLPIGGGRLTDGWGEAFVLLASDGSTEVAADEEVEVIRSLGSNAVDGEDAGEVYTRDVDIAFVDTTVSPTLNRYQTELSVTVWQRAADGSLEIPSGTGQLTVRLFSPDEGDIGVVAGSVTLSTLEDRAPVQVMFGNVTMGTHVVRAYEEAGTNRKSPPLEIAVHPQGSASWQLILPAGF